MSLTYIGNCAWEQSAEPQPTDPPNELPTTIDRWMGRTDQTDAFRAAHPIGGVWLGGYITDNTPRHNSPFFGMSEIDLVVARPPDFVKFLAENTTSLKTASKSAQVDTSLVIDGASTVSASKSVSYYAPETTYTYFASAKPIGARFSVVDTTAQPSVISSVITAQGTGTNGSETKTYGGGSAPAPLASALSMAVEDSLVSHTATPIPGTPWYRCQDVISRGYQGDGQ